MKELKPFFDYLDPIKQLVKQNKFVARDIFCSRYIEQDAKPVKYLETDMFHNRIQIDYKKGKNEKNSVLIWPPICNLLRKELKDLYMANEKNQIIEGIYWFRKHERRDIKIFVTNMNLMTRAEILAIEHEKNLNAEKEKHI